MSPGLVGDVPSEGVKTRERRATATDLEEAQVAQRTVGIACLSRQGGIHGSAHCGDDKDSDSVRDEKEVREQESKKREEPEQLVQLVCPWLTWNVPAGQAVQEPIPLPCA